MKLVEALLKTDDAIVVSDNRTKRLALRILRERGVFCRVRFMTPRDFIDAALFPLTDRTLLSIARTLGQPLEVASPWLSWVHGNAESTTPRLTTLQTIKANAKAAGLLKPAPHAEALFHRKTVLVDYVMVDDRLEKALTCATHHGARILNINETPTPNVGVWREDNADTALARVACAVRQAHAEGTPLNAISLMVADPVYVTPARRLLRAFGIPFNDHIGTLLGHTDTAKRFLAALEASDNPLETAIHEAYNALTSTRGATLRAIQSEAVRALDACDNLADAKAFLRYRFARRRLPNQAYDNAVTLAMFDPEKTRGLNKLYVLGCTEGMFPRFATDDLLSDDERHALGFWRQSERNNRIEQAVMRSLAYPDQTILSVARDVHGETHVPAGVLAAFADADKPVLLGQRFSDLYDTLKGKEAYDAYMMYGAKREERRLITGERLKQYNAYDHAFDGISQATLARFLPDKPTVSYSALQHFFACKFRYYADHVLTLRPREENFTLDIGNFFHQILEQTTRGENLEIALETAKAALTNERSYAAKERFFLDVACAALRRAVPIIHAQRARSGYTIEATEKRVVHENDVAYHKGFIDQVLSHTTDDVIDTVLIDYKTGKATLNLRMALYGLSAQLLYYVWLLMKTEPETRRIQGFYEQTVFYRPTKLKEGERLNESLEQHLAWQGYTVEDVAAVLTLDPDVETGSFLKGARITNQGTLHGSFRTFTPEALEALIGHLETLVHEATTQIVEGDFTIDPKTDGKHDFSCTHCPFNDVCYKDDSDYTVLDVPKNDKELFARLRQGRDKR